MKPFSKILLFILLTFVTVNTCNSQSAKTEDCNQLWLDCHLTKVLPFNVFSAAIAGYSKIKGIKKKNLIIIIDFSKPSTDKRFFVIDIVKKQILFQSFVAHGKNSGENSATTFSNKSESLKSSLGFYLTAETYTGKNGYSLKLDGLEKGINDNARAREIVIHGAEYVSQEFIIKYGRLGRSWGCPALPVEISKEIIDMISNGSCLFIYAVDSFYKSNSTLI
jgi:hypothetical protein